MYTNEKWTDFKNEKFKKDLQYYVVYNENPALFAENCPVVGQQCGTLYWIFLKKGQKAVMKLSKLSIATLMPVLSALRVLRRTECLYYFSALGLLMNAT